jgi:uncharacterized membrane protein YheB (UPF0754 family)
MKTIKQLQKEIDEIVTRLQKEELKKNVQTKLRKQIQFLRFCIKYIETQPAKDFLVTELSSIEKKITLRMNAFDESKYSNIARSEVSKIRKEYEKMHEIPKLKTRIKTIKFLLAA